MSREEPVECTEGDNVAVLEAQFEQPTSKAQDSLNKLLAGFPSVPGDRDRRIETDGSEAAQALANVGA